VPKNVKGDNGDALEVALIFVIPLSDPTDPPLRKSNPLAEVLSGA
jgi:hypothetical protein